MMSDFLPRRTATFIVRIWAEYLEQTPPAWRGEIEHIEGGERAYLREASDILRFIAYLTGGDADAEDNHPDRQSQQQPAASNRGGAS